MKPIKIEYIVQGYFVGGVMGVGKSERYMYMKRQVDLLGLNLFTTQQRQEKVPH